MRERGKRELGVSGESFCGAGSCCLPADTQPPIKAAKVFKCAGRKTCQEKAGARAALWVLRGESYFCSSLKQFSLQGC